MSAVRLSVKAIVVSDGRLLVLRCRDAAGDWYMLPGGGVSFAETVHQALERECLEEAGARIQVGLCDSFGTTSPEITSSLIRIRTSTKSSSGLPAN